MKPCYDVAGAEVFFMNDCSGEIRVFLQFTIIVLLTGIPGVLGGLTKALSPWISQQNQSAGAADSISWRTLLANAITGFGGSMAAVLVTLWARRFPVFPYDVEGFLTLFSMGYIAGYAANKLLPAVADSLADKLAQVAKEQRDLAEKTQSSIDAATHLSTQLTRTYDYLQKAFFIEEETKGLIQSLSELVRLHPTHRTLNILLGRLWDEAARDWKKALEIMQAFITNKLQLDQKDADLATAYWNAANYLVEGFQASKQPALLSQALEAMRQSILCAPEYREEFRKDEDFAVLRSLPEAQAILQVPPQTA
jgi:hypothetical protein